MLPTRFRDARTRPDYATSPDLLQRNYSASQLGDKVAIRKGASAKAPGLRLAPSCLLLRASIAAPTSVIIVMKTAARVQTLTPYSAMAHDSQAYSLVIRASVQVAEASTPL